MLSCTLNSESNNLYLYIKSKDFLYYISKILKKNMYLRASILIDICVIDKPFSFLRYELIYNFLSINFNSRFFLKIFCSENVVIHSLSNIFLNSLWIEREI